VYVHVNAKEQDLKYRGLLLYGESEETGKKVGGFEIPEENDVLFHTPQGSCEEKAIMHSGAELKNYHHVFAFRAPKAGAGTIIFKGLVKSGPANTGAFWWPNKDGHLKLTETTAPQTNAWIQDAPAVNKWIKGQPGISCATTCKQRGGACDESQLKTVNSAEQFLNGPAKTNACKLPILKSCSKGDPSESMDDGFCHYHAANCEASQAQSCDQKDPALSLFCPCRGAVSVKSPPPPPVADECEAYCSRNANPCIWTKKWSCPWSSKKGSKGTAANGGEIHYKCCCGLNKVQDGCGADDQDIYSLDAGDDDTWAEVVKADGDDDTWAEVDKAEEPVCDTLTDQASCEAAGCDFSESDGMVICAVNADQERDMDHGDTQ